MNERSQLEPIQPAASQVSGAGTGAGAGPKVQVMGIEIPTGSDPHSVRRRIEAMEIVLERSFTIPGTRIPVGLDSIVGLIPVVGDLIAAGMAAYIVWEARNLDLPRWQLWRMAGNIALDTAVGTVPVVGDALDFIYRSNSRNLKIVKKHLDKHHPQTRVIEQ